jgi:two-component sensor histidine kinase/AmiR/NasT family two-component response regulator
VPINILVVDDEPKNLIVVETVLNDPAYRLVKAESADQALLALLVDDFAVLILDIRMPGVTGIELARMIKERKKTSQVPIIFLTAYYNEDQHVLDGYGAGAVDYLLKPVNPDILRSKVAVFAELYRMQKLLTESNHALVAEVSQRRQAEEQLRNLNDTLEQRVMERTRALRASAELLRTVTDNASVGLATIDLDGRYVFGNPAYCRIFGLPDDFAGTSALGKYAELLNQAYGGQRATFEAAISGSDYYSIVLEPERDAEGTIIGLVVVVFDITNRKQTEEQIRLLLSEVNHRSKNLLSVVSAIARQTKAPSREEFLQRFSDRLQALAASHDLLSKSQWQSVAVLELLKAQLAHFADLIDGRIFFDGPPLKFSVEGAQCIGMVVHELATNAAKYGALSNQSGRIDISWRIASQAAGDRLLMSWIERHGPPVQPPQNRGYGSSVIQTIAELSLDGKVQLEFAATGLIWRLECPLTKISDRMR